MNVLLGDETKRNREKAQSGSSATRRLTAVLANGLGAQGQGAYGGVEDWYEWVRLE
jgi:hypothetical protein